MLDYKNWVVTDAVQVSVDCLRVILRPRLNSRRKVEIEFCYGDIGGLFFLERKR